MNIEGSTIQAGLVPVSVDQRRVGAGEIIRVIRRRRVIIIATFVIVLAITGLVLALMTPLYTATAVLMVQTRTPNVGGSQQMVVTGLDDELKIASSVELLKAPALARRVVRVLDLWAYPEFAPPKGVKPAPAAVTPPRSPADQEKAILGAQMEAITDKLMSRVTVSRINKSNLIAVNVDSVKPEDAARIANSIAQTYIKSRASDAEDENESDYRKLSKQVEQLREKLVAADTAVAVYKRDHNLVNGADIHLAEIDRLAGDLGDARAARAESSSRAGLLDRAIQSGGAAQAAAVGNSPVLTELRNQDTLLTKRLAELTSFYGEGHPDVVNTRAQLADVRTRIAQETSRLSEDLRNSSAIASLRERQVAGDLSAARSQALQAGTAGVRLLDLERDADTSRTLYLTLLAKLKGDQGQDTDADTSIVSAATTPISPSHPEPKRTLGAAVVAAAILATILALVAEALDNRMRTAAQVEELLDLPTLAMVPDIRRSLRRTPAPNLLLEQPRSRFAEALRGLYVNVMESVPQRSAATMVVVTSPLPGDGKSTLAASLAAAAIAMRRNAIVVDLDLHRPDLLETLGRIDGPDLLDYLAGRATLNEVISTETGKRGLPVIGAREAAVDPGSLISAPELEHLLTDLRKRYDFIVVSTAPVLAVQDAHILSRLADATLLVLRWGKTGPDTVRAATALLGGRLTGVVMNRVHYRRHAARAHGDAIQHYRYLAPYYAGTEDGVSAVRRAWRRLGGGRRAHA